MAFIEIENLKYRYPKAERLALDGISLSIEKGSFVGIIGRNGAGKSTLASAIIGLVPQFYKGAYGGKVSVAGMDAATVPVGELSRKVGLIFQNPFNQLSGAKDNVYEETCFGMQNFGIEPDEMRRRADETLKMLGIYDFRDRNPFDLSGGQTQRVAIASILVLHPEVIILDEPTSQLDPAGSDEVFKAVERLTEEGITVIMIEQKIDKIAEYSDRMILLDGGKLIADGTPDEVLSREDLDAYGIIPPASVRISKALGYKDGQGFYPATADKAVKLLSGKIQFKQHIEDDKTTQSSERISVQNLSFHYHEGFDILHDFSLSLDGRTTAIIGQNGAGKTTLAKLLKGLLKPSEGKILFDGNDISSSTAASLAGSIGYVFQNPDDQIFKPKVIDEVMFGPLNIGMDDKDAKESAMEALSMVNLASASERNPYDLDLHERKLVALASVIAMDPDVIILDEPTIAQDDSGKQLIQKIIRELRDNGKLVISILHDMDLVAASFERVIAMSSGSVIADGTPREVFSNEDILRKAGLELPHITMLAKKLGSESAVLSDDEFLSESSQLYG